MELIAYRSDQNTIEASLLAAHTADAWGQGVLDDSSPSSCEGDYIEVSTTMLKDLFCSLLLIIDDEPKCTCTLLIST
jgi:hypothetical protein